MSTKCYTESPVALLVDQSTLQSMPRVVSLVPSATETLSAWGVHLIGCTRFCERNDITIVGGTKNPQIETITELQPDLVIMDREENRREDYEELLRREVPVHTLAIRSIFDVESEFNLLAERLHLPTRSHIVLPEPSNHSPLRVTVPIWRRPWMVLGTPTYGASLLTYLGLIVVPGHQGPYPTLTPLEFETIETELLLTPDEPYRFGERHREELERTAPTFFCDGKDLFWWGIRTPHALRRLDHLISEIRSTLHR